MPSSLVVVGEAAWWLGLPAARNGMGGWLGRVRRNGRQVTEPQDPNAAVAIVAEPPALAIDIGGTKLAAGLVAPTGDLLVRRERPTPPAPPGQGRLVTEALLGLLDEVLETTVGPRSTHPTPVAVGLACAGPIDVVAGTVSPVNIPAWRDEPLVAAVAQHLGITPVRLVNDAVAMTVGEHGRGAARGAANVLGIVVSTGVGGGLVLDGRPRLGPTGNAGHLGHTVIAVDGEPCPCGSRGCVETRASASAMVREALARGWDPRGTGGDGATADGRALASAAAADDPAARAAIERGATALAAGIVSAAALLDLDLVVVGGGFAAAGEVFFAPLRRQTDALRGLAYLARLRIVPAALGRDAGLVGAALAAGVT
jgi:glucokinase